MQSFERHCSITDVIRPPPPPRPRRPARTRHAVRAARAAHISHDEAPFSDADGCDIDFAAEALTADEDLPVAAGGVAL